MGFVNLPIVTSGGKVWWNTLERKSGWKLQQHKLSGHYRILDPEDVRQAWDSSYSVIVHEFRKFTGEVSL